MYGLLSSFISDDLEWPWKSFICSFVARFFTCDFMQFWVVDNISTAIGCCVLYYNNRAFFRFIVIVLPNVTAVDLTRDYKLQACSCWQSVTVTWRVTDILLVVLDWCIDAAREAAVSASHLMCTRRTSLHRPSAVADAATATHQYVWYECDDDAVRTLTQDKFLLKLKNSKNFTPYLLFYTKCYRCMWF